MSLRWAHSHFVGFVVSWLNYELERNQVISGIFLEHPVFKGFHLGSSGKTGELKLVN